MSARRLPCGRRSNCLARSDGRARLFTIAPERPFASALASGLIARFPDPLDRARLLILLPSRRSVAALRDALLTMAEGEASLLPRMAAVGDVDEDEALGRFAEDGADAPILPPAVEPAERSLALARIAGPFLDAGPPAALALGDALGRVIDQLSIHGVNLAALRDLELAEMAGHWQRARLMLTAVAEAWPALLAERGRMAAAERREQLLAALAERWAAHPPAHPVIAAGFAQAPPGVARLLAAITRLPGGMLVLPGIDPDVSEAWREAVADRAAATHPLHGMLALLDAIGAAPAECALWEEGPVRAPGGTAARAAALSHAFLPAALAGAWREGAEGADGLTLLEARTAEAEALGIALAMRRQLQTPGATAALVTPSRALARRVAGALRRFGLDISDSAGEPLRLTRHGILIEALTAAASARFTPVALLALLKHPLAAGSDPAARQQWLAQVRELDLALRGLAPPAGLAGIGAHLAARPAGDALLAWWTAQVQPLLSPLEALASGTPTLAALLAALRETAAALCGDILWSGISGRALSRWLEALEITPDAALLPVPMDAAPRMIGLLMEQMVVRPPWRQHPRLAIWGPLEARLQSADLMILGGLNEGEWPAPPAVDPWLAPAIRAALGLPTADIRIGLQAHDLWAAACAAPRVLLTRAEKDDSGSAVPSRFLLRIEAALGRLPRDAELEAALLLDGGDAPQRLPMPAPAPPRAARPTQLSVTDADMLAADPFSFYARRILKLSELDPLEQEADAALRGIAVHKIAEALGKDRQTPLAPLVDAALQSLRAGPALETLWRPRLLRLAQWLAEQLERDQAEDWTVARTEAKARLERHGILLHGRADRVDRHADGDWRIIDYKTGSQPNKSQFEAGEARQLPLLRLLLESGGFADLPAGDVRELLYVRLRGGSTPSSVDGAKWEADRDSFMADLDAMLARWLTGDAPFPPKLKPLFALNYRSFDHLARLEEWLGRD